MKASTAATTKSNAPGKARALVATLAGLLALVAIAPATASARWHSDPEACTDPSSQPFLSWGDDDLYRLAPGGDFEGALPDWNFDGDSGTVSESSPLGGDTVATLAPGSRVTTAPICTDGTELFSRMFSRSADGDPRSAIVVEAIAPNGRSRLVGFTRSDDEWGPTHRFLAPLGFARAGYDSFRYRFTAIGRGTTLIDGIYIDPRIRG